MTRKKGNLKKTSNDLKNYKDMVKKKTKYELTDENEIYSSLTGTEETNANILLDDKKEEIQKEPFLNRFQGVLEKYSTQLLIAIIGIILGWGVLLQVGIAVQDEKINNIEKDIEEIKTNFKQYDSSTEDRYLRKDLFDLKMQYIEKQIEDLKKSMN